jgi:gamma-glutamyltranspeptidase/glutathione hydrolase
LYRFKTNNLRFLFLSLLTATTAILICSCAGFIFKKEEHPLIPPTPEVVSKHGMIVCAHPVAAQVGLEVLEEGGNAVDAAVASLLALNVVEPYASGLGGGGYMNIRMAGQSSVFLNYREKAPKNVDTSLYYHPEDSLRVFLQEGASSVCVPGNARGLSMALKRFGTKDLKRLISPAIGLAIGGYTVTPGLSAQITSHFESIQKDSGLSAAFLKDSLPYQPNDHIKLGDLGNSLRRLQDHGLEYFYDSVFCIGMVEPLQKLGSAITIQDFQDYDAKWVEPIHGTYRGYDIVTVPPPSSGGIAMLEILNILEQYDLSKMKYGSPELIHLMSEAIKQGYIDADTWTVDPDFYPIPLDTLLSKQYAIRRAAEIDLNKTRTQVTAYEPPKDPGNTTHLVVIDSQGNIVSVTQSINYFFGAQLMIPQLGIIPNNQMSDFSWSPGRRNSVEGGKRPRSNMTPTVIYLDGDPFLIIGTPGGARIASTMVQIIVNVIDFHMPINQAIDAPRFYPVREHLVMENRFPTKVQKRLKKMGHVIHLTGPLDVYFGGAHAILIDQTDGSMHGAADPRRDGKAMGY